MATPERPPRACHLRLALRGSRYSVARKNGSGSSSAKADFAWQPIVQRAHVKSGSPASRGAAKYFHGGDQPNPALPRGGRGRRPSGVSVISSAVVVPKRNG